MPEYLIVRIPISLVIDLDPVEIEFSRVVEVELEFRSTFENPDIKSYCKTTGSRGLHIYVPIVPNITHKQAQAFVKQTQGHMHKKTREITSFERSPSKRRGKVYLDYLQNGRGKTMASVYSLRPKPRATISTSLEWDEVNRQPDPRKFTIEYVLNRIEIKGDVWDGFFHKATDFKKRLDIS